MYIMQCISPHKIVLSEMLEDLSCHCYSSSKKAWMGRLWMAHYLCPEQYYGWKYCCRPTYLNVNDTVIYAASPQNSVYCFSRQFLFDEHQSRFECSIWFSHPCENNGWDGLQRCTLFVFWSCSTLAFYGWRFLTFKIRACVGWLTCMGGWPAGWLLWLKLTCKHFWNLEMAITWDYNFHQDWPILASWKATQE